MAALLMTALLGFVGLAIDAGMLYAERRQVQNAADEASLAATRVIANGGTTAEAQAIALEYAAANGYSGASVSVNIPPTSGEFSGQSDYLEVAVESEPPTAFIQVLIPGGTSVSARGVSTFTTGAGEGYAIFANDDDCGASDPLQISGSTNTITGAVHSNSELKVNGSNNTFNGSSTYACGLDVGGQNNTFNPAPQQAPTQPLPINYAYNDFPCTMTFSQPTNLNAVPAAWVGGNNNSGQLIPGVYCSTKKLSLSGSDVSGQVTFVSQGEVNVSGSNFDLTPYWNNVLAFSDASFPKGIDVSASGGSWDGLLLATDGLVKLAGSSSFSYSGGIIGDRIQVSGSDFSITAVDYGQGGPAVIALVE